jgi:hypothetical protein
MSAMIACGFFLTSCLLPGMIPLTSETATSEAATREPATREPTADMPKMETNADTVLEALKGGDFNYLQLLAEEKYTDEDFAKPGTLTFTVKITDQKPTYFNYGWCTKTEEILKQNFEHIKLRLSFNGEVLGQDVVHAISSTRPDGFICLEFGVLLSDWPAGEYNLEAMVTFDEKINDGAADFEAGDYIYQYNVTVNK